MTEPMLTAPILQVRDLRKSYDEGRIEALRGVDLAIAAGDFLSISGPSGSGKSTLLQLLGGLDTPTTGEVLFKNEKLGTAIDLDTYRSRSVGFIFQAFHLLPTLRVLENVQVPMLALNPTPHNRAERAEALLCEMGLEHRLRQYPNELSAGERQRVAIARALANEPELLLADEPTGNLDSVNSARIMEILTGIQKARGMTLIVVTHENAIAHSAARQIRIRDGRIELHGPLWPRRCCCQWLLWVRMRPGRWQHRARASSRRIIAPAATLSAWMRMARASAIPSPSRRIGFPACCV
jgi:putative ABC transport system ATP-binding protein